MMILYKCNRREKREKRENPKYKLRLLDIDTKREIELSRHIMETVPYWEYYFFLIREIKQTTVRDIYQQTTDRFRPQQVAEYVLLSYHRDDLSRWYDWNQLLSSSSSSNDMKLVYHSYHHCIDLLLILDTYSILFVGFNDENLQISLDGTIRVGKIKNGLKKENVNKENILSIEYRVDKAIYYPIDYYFIQYIEENNIFSPTIETIENVWYKWKKIVVESTIGIYFTEYLLEQLKKQYVTRYESFINESRENIYVDNINEWNRYSINILYLSIMREKDSLLIEEVLLQSILMPMKMESFFDKMIEEMDWKKNNEEKKIKMYL